ncbi:MAG: hypothetical protein IJU90_05455 [Bacteroidales bacterium]|nr:hypothetical protein [Bacteroidales bacterium]
MNFLCSYRTFFAVAVLSLSMAMTTACSKDDNDSTPAQPSVNVFASERYTLQQLVEEAGRGRYIQSYLGDNETVLALVENVLKGMSDRRSYRIDTIFANRENVPLNQYKRDWHIESHLFTYHSVSSTGEPTVLSGRVTFPTADDGNGHRVGSLSLYVHHYIGTAIAPTKAVSPLTLRTVYNSAVIEPDLQGYGVDDAHIFCGFDNETQARQMKDCLFAAIEVMRQHGVTLADDGYTTAWGYSLATPAVMSFIRLHDQTFSQSERQTIRLHSAFVGGAPMRLDQMLLYFNQHPEFDVQLMRYSIPFLSAMPQSIFGNYQLSDFAADWMHNYTISKEGQTCTFFYGLTHFNGTTSLWPDTYSYSKLNNILASDMFNADSSFNFSNPKCVSLFSIMTRLSDWGSWSPSVDVYASHGTNDDRMPYDQDRATFDRMGKGGKIHWKDTYAGILRNVMNGSHQMLTILASFSMVQYNTPAEAFNKGL